MRYLLAQRGKQIESELPGINAVTAELTSADLDAICLHAVALGCSGDILVSPSAVKARRTPSAAIAPPSASTLLGTLGLSPDATGGEGVTVALIDSGIHPAAAFGNRIKAFYDFTQGGVRASPLRRLRPWHARRGPDRRLSDVQ